MLVLELARDEFILRRENIIALGMNGDSYRLKQSASRRRASATIDVTEQNPATAETADQADAAPIGPATI